MRYATMLLRRRRDDIDGTFSVTIETPPHGKRAAFAMPVEGDRWVATLTAGYGADAPHDENEFRAIAATLPSPYLHEIVTRAEPLAPMTTHRLVSSRRKRFERCKRLPAGFLALGDSVCSFNPVYGQGMTCAVLQAVALGECLTAAETNDTALVRATYRRAAKVLDTPWKIAVGADFAYPETTGPKAPGTDFVNRYMARVLLAAQVSSQVNTALIMVQNLVAPVQSLMKPSLMRKVFAAAREAERRNAAAASASPSRVAA
jgi:2-polyprenyl-6-methoxyphenol hydroxylase-like FAD-dependent oxidoreductase